MEAAGYSRVGLLGTRFTMDEPFLVSSEDGESFRHQRIVLQCETTAPGYEDIVFEADDPMEDLRVIAEFVGTIA